MTLKELNKKITAIIAVNERHGDSKVCVVTNDKAMGEPSVEIESTAIGFDMSRGKFLLIPSEKLIKLQ